MVHIFLGLVWMLGSGFGDLLPLAKLGCLRCRVWIWFCPFLPWGVVCVWCILVPFYKPLLSLEVIHLQLEPSSLFPPMLFLAHFPLSAWTVNSLLLCWSKNCGQTVQLEVSLPNYLVACCSSAIGIVPTTGCFILTVRPSVGDMLTRYFVLSPVLDKGSLWRLIWTAILCQWWVVLVCCSGGKHVESIVWWLLHLWLSCYREWTKWLLYSCGPW